MSDSIFKAEPQTYKFEFGCNENIYSTQFIGEIPLGADTGLLKEVRKHLLEESSAIIWSYLEHNHIDYSHFTSSIKTLEHDRIPHYKIIGQTFEDNGDASQGYFTMRENRDNHLLLDIATESGEPIFPSFGCVDTLNLLIGIDQIKTIEQTKETAIL